MLEVQTRKPARTFNRAANIRTDKPTPNSMRTRGLYACTQPLFMEQTNVGRGTQKTEARLAVTPNDGATLVRGAIEGPSTTPSSTPEPPEAPAVNPHLLSDADVQLFQQGTHCRLQEKLGAHSATVSCATPSNGL